MDQPKKPHKRFIDPATGEPIEELGEDTVAHDFEILRERLRMPHEAPSPFEVRNDPFGLGRED